MLDAASRSRDFPSLAEMAYFNTAAEGIPPLAVRQALAEYFEDKQLGMDGLAKHEEQRHIASAVAGALYGLSPGEVSICSCSSEAFNLAALALQLRDGDEVVINDLDFPAGATPWLQESCPATVKVWRSKSGQLDSHDLAVLLSPRTRFVTTSLVSFFNGAMLPLDAVTDVVRRHSSALLGVDVTQALGRIPLHLQGVDFIVSSTHKWILASHGGGLVGVPQASADRWNVPAGGWFHLYDAFGPERFEHVRSRSGAAGFAVGMPNYPAIYAIRAALEYIQGVGVPAIHAAAQPLTERVLSEVAAMPVELLTPRDPALLAGIVAFRHPAADRIHAALLSQNIHVMLHAGRLRIAVHGYNTEADVTRLLQTLRVAIGAA